MKIIALAGGVGGSKLVDGLAQVIPPEDLTVIVNTADDFTHLGLKICPDLDTVLYTLAGKANPATGWGRAEETWQVMGELGRIGGPTWFQLGDKDLALHLYRAGRLQSGMRLSQVTTELRHAFGVEVAILPMSDDEVATIVETDQGEIPFQEYFVALRWEPAVKGFRYSGAQEAAPAPGVLDAIEMAEAVIICPSNPWVSIDPILAIAGIRPALQGRPVLGVSPIIAGEALKGPAAKMFADLGEIPSAAAVARHYEDFLSVLFLDEADQGEIDPIREFGVRPVVADIVMDDRSDRARLAGQVLRAAEEIASGRVQA